MYGDCCKHGIGGMRCEHCFPVRVRNERARAGSASTRQIGGDHYKHMAIQPAEFCYKNNLNCLESAAIKYIVRHKQKHGASDVDKAIHYLELLKEWEYASE